MAILGVPQCLYSPQRRTKIPPPLSAKMPARLPTLFAVLGVAISLTTTVVILSHWHNPGKPPFHTVLEATGLFIASLGLVGATKKLTLELATPTNDGGGQQRRAKRGEYPPEIVAVILSRKLVKDFMKQKMAEVALAQDDEQQRSKEHSEDVQKDRVPEGKEGHESDYEGIYIPPKHLSKKYYLGFGRWCWRSHENARLMNKKRPTETEGHPSHRSPYRFERFLQSETAHR